MAKSTSLCILQAHTQTSPDVDSSDVCRFLHVCFPRRSDSNNLHLPLWGGVAVLPKGCQCSLDTLRSLHFLSKASVQILHQLSGPFSSLTEGTVKAHFQTAPKPDRHKIFTLAILMTYHTILFKSGF